ncbi:hypothetical protein GS461_06370 [Rhodococcus hoagii]|nr:hypothetical protein [Prescottella equi]
MATAPDGTELQPVVVGGWQQGWIVPAGTDGVVTLTFPSDRWYRAGIAFGLLLLIPLALLALVPRADATANPSRRDRRHLRARGTASSRRPSG